MELQANIQSLIEDAIKNGIFDKNMSYNRILDMIFSESGQTINYKITPQMISRWVNGGDITPAFQIIIQQYIKIKHLENVINAKDDILRGALNFLEQEKLEDLKKEKEGKKTSFIVLISSYHLRYFSKQKTQDTTQEQNTTQEFEFTDFETANSFYEEEVKKIPSALKEGKHNYITLIKTDKRSVFEKIKQSNLVM